MKRRPETSGQRRGRCSRPHSAAVFSILIPFPSCCSPQRKRNLHPTLTRRWRNHSALCMRRQDPRGTPWMASSAASHRATPHAPRRRLRSARPSASSPALLISDTGPIPGYGSIVESLRSTESIHGATCRSNFMLDRLIYPLDYSGETAFQPRFPGFFRVRAEGHQKTPRGKRGTVGFGKVW